MKILIVGLGLIGASYAMGLKKEGNQIFGVARHQSTIDYALENNVIDDGSLEPADFIEKSDLIIIGLYPNDIIDFLAKYRHLFNENQIVTDVCGLKEMICDKAYELAKPALFVGHHPMAGKEKVGIRYADPKIFLGANFLITPVGADTERGVALLKDLASQLGFGKIHVISPKHHDQMVAYTSELTHAIAISLVNSEASFDVSNFIGDSYRDLTRIAVINEDLWSQLFLANKDNLIEEIDKFMAEVSEIKKALENTDEAKLKELFVKAKEKRSKM